METQDRNPRRSAIAAVLVFTPALTLLAFIFAARVLWGVPVSYFMRDPAATLGGKFYAGLASNFGALLWCTAAAACFFGYAVLRSSIADSNDANDRLERRFLLASGALTTLLLLDDLFQLHEEVYRVYLGVPERIVVLVYGALVLAYLWRFRAVIRNSDYGWLVAAFGLFGVSVVVDEVVLLPHLHHLVEDGSKLLGITSWCAFLWRTSLTLIAARTTVGAADEVVPETALPAADTAATPFSVGCYAGGRAARGRASRDLTALDFGMLAAFAAPSRESAAPTAGVIFSTFDDRLSDDTEIPVVHDAEIPELATSGTPQTL